ncbi:acyl carrier protein [Rhodococcoides kroppenstedtii]|uniref:acyl carrier protein n=1 Tax=Rhodococcoides kroppenstedtii TaxID=293050 RepID=UPI001BDE01F2|nr:acyl carrier protein [Rhodococcus kroppenstedtii]MBT1191161.1 acyl carrier protein [Rhodococcus kroppenstedtii]
MSTTAALDVDRIRQILATHGKLPVAVDAVADDDDLYDAGLTSHASVNVMIALEDEFDVEFPDELLQKATFASITAIADALSTLEQ